MKIGILGGAFNPIHLGHIKLAENSINLLNLSKVYFLPSFHHPFKLGDFQYTFQDRCEMIKLSIQDSSILNDSNSEVCLIESILPPPNYTYNTLNELKTRNPNDEFYFLMGADNLKDLTKWKDINKLFDEFKVFIFYRKGIDKETIFSQIEVNINQELFQKIKKQFIFSNIPEISSTFIRENIKSELSLKTSLSENVIQYLQTKELK